MTSFDDLVARGSAQHAPARHRGRPFMEAIAGVACGVGVTLGILAALCIYGDPS